MSHDELVGLIVNAGMTLELMHFFGWQGGTVHQVADELLSNPVKYRKVLERLS